MHYKSLKTVNQLLKHNVNRCVLSLRLNECKLSASRTAAGRLFHTTGPATEKALSPSLVLVRGTVYSRCLTPSGDESVPDHCCTLLITEHVNEIRTEPFEVYFMKFSETGITILGVGRTHIHFLNMTVICATVTL